MVRAEGKGRELIGIAESPHLHLLWGKPAPARSSARGEPGCSCPPILLHPEILPQPLTGLVSLSSFLISSPNSGG